MAEPNSKHKNMKVLSAEKGGTFQKDGKTIQKYKVILQGEDGNIVQGDAKDPLPQGFAKDFVVPETWVYEIEYQGETFHNLFFPTPKGSGGSGGGRSYGKSAEELAVMKMEVVSKLTEMPFRYAVDAAVAGVKAKDVIEIYEEFVKISYEKFKEMMG